MLSIVCLFAPPVDSVLTVVMIGNWALFTVMSLLDVKDVPLSATAPLVERYVTTILLPGSGFLPKDTPSPKFNS